MSGTTFQNDMEDRDDLHRECLEEELKKIFMKKESLESVRISAREMKKCIESLETSKSMDYGEVCHKLAKVLNILSMIIPSIPLFTFTLTFSCLSSVLNGLGDALRLLAKPFEQDKTYSELQKYQDSEIRSEAIGFEKAFFNNNAFLNEIEINAPESVIHNLEDKIPVNDIVRFLGKLQAKTQELILTQDVISACRATAYINLYFRLAILRKLVLWQVFCIKERSGYERSTTKGVLAMIRESQKTDLEMVRYVTEANVEKAVFLTVFHPKENENFLHFLRIEDIRIPSIGQDKDFHNQVYAITLSKSPNITLEMSSWYKGSIDGTTGTSDACRFMFEPVKGRNLDNIFYLKSKLWPEYYVFMCSDGTCESMKGKPGATGQWKLVRFENDIGPPQYVVSSLQWPGRFLYTEPSLLFDSIKSTHDLKTVKDRGLWELRKPRRGFFSQILYTVECIKSFSLRFNDFKEEKDTGGKKKPVDEFF